MAADGPVESDGYRFYQVDAVPMDESGCPYPNPQRFTYFWYDIANEKVQRASSPGTDCTT